MEAAMAAEDQAPGDQGTGDPFTEWYNNVILAHPERYDPAHFSEGQARAWFPLWSGHGFRSSKVDAQGNPIQGDSFEHPDECPPGTQAYGQNACVPSGAIPGGGGGHPGGGGGFGGGGGGGWGPTGPFDYAYPEFEAPDAQSIFNDPGYQARLAEGRGSLEASAAARGTLNTGGTLQDILRQGQDYASQEYGNAFNRAKDIFGAKLGKYKSEWDKYTYGTDDEFRREGLLSGIQYPQWY
jgi:hypothetical protein